MPYIEQKRRKILDPLIDRLGGNIPIGRAGELNYVITRLISQHFYHGGFDVTYSGLNTALGILEAVKLEFYRRVVTPYEDKKREENGDVYV